MVFLAVTHFVAQHHGDFIVIGDDVEEAAVDAHVVAHGTESVEALVIVDEIIIWFIVNCGVN